MIFQTEMDFDACATREESWLFARQGGSARVPGEYSREASGREVLPPGGVPTSYIEDRAVLPVTKQGAEGTRPYDDRGKARSTLQQTRTARRIDERKEEKRQGKPIRLVVY